MAGTVGYSTLPQVYDSDTGLTGSMARVSYGSTQYFTIRGSAATGLTTGYSTSSNTFVTPPWARGIVIYQDVSVVVSATSGNATITTEIQTIDPLSGNAVSMSSGGWFIGSSSSQTGYNGSTGTLALTVYPGIANSTGRQVSGALPGQWKAVTTLAGSSLSLTFSVSGQYIP